MSEDTNLNNTSDNQEKKKQKAGLNAVRPGDFTEHRFKELAKEADISQTEMFERIFWNYIKAQNDEKKNNVLNLEGEINLIAKGLTNILEHFKTITEKAQNTVISLKTNAEQTEKNLYIEIDTLSKKIEEIEKRNAELEQANNAFTEIKTGLEKRIHELEDINGKKDAEIKAIYETSKDNEKRIKDLEKELSIKEKELKNLDSTTKNLEDAAASKDSKIRNLESTNESLSSTLSKMETLKKSEISSIEAKYKVTITELETKIESIREQVEKELDAEKKLALAEIKLELAETKSKYAEVLTELNSCKQTKPTKKAK